MSIERVLIDGQWRVASVAKIFQEDNPFIFQAVNPATRLPLPREYPISPWPEVEQAIFAAARVARELQNTPGEIFAKFLERFAERIDSRSGEFIATANQETALPVEPRLKIAELPRTTNQIRQAAAAARDGGWAMPTIHEKQHPQPTGTDRTGRCVRAE